MDVRDLGLDDFAAIDAAFNTILSVAVGALLRLDGADVIDIQAENVGGEYVVELHGLVGHRVVGHRVVRLDGDVLDEHARLILLGIVARCLRERAGRESRRLEPREREAKNRLVIGAPSTKGRGRRS